MVSGNWPRLLSILALLALAIPLAVVQPASGDGEDDRHPILEKTELKYPNLSFMLNQLVARVEAGESLPEEAAEDSPVHQGSSMAVTIYLSDHVADAVQFLEDTGGDPRNVGEDYIEAYVPVTLLGLASEQPGVSRVRLIVPPQPLQSAPPVTGQGVQAHGSAAWNQAGYRGQGVKVGIIDTSFAEFVDLMGTELPATVQARCYPDIGVFTQDPADCDLGNVHGTIVAESVIDIAPEVSLYIANPQSPGDLQAAADWMVSEGVSVINHSVGWVFDGPGDGSSPVSNSPLRTVDRAVAGGIVWINAAGNEGETTWFGRYSDFDGDALIDFDGADEFNTILPSGACNVEAQLRWEDSWGGATRDFDLYIVDTFTGEIVAGSEDTQSGEAGDVPYESLSLPFSVNEGDDQYALAVVHHSGSAPDWLQLTVWGANSIEHYSERGSITNPAESANPGMLAVGAAPWYDVHTIEPYSSRGPSPDGRVKPDIVGADCGETALRPLDQDNCGFSGTSQAAPHVAGMAALVRQRFPELTPEGVSEYLKDHTERRAAIPNNTWGYGFAQLPAHDAVAPTPLQDVVFAEPSWYSVQLQTYIARHMVEHGYGYTTSAVTGSSLDLLQGLRDGDNHVLMEVWPTHQSEIWDAAVAAGEILDLGTSLGHDWRSAFVIPAYLQEQYPGLDNVEDLKQHRYKDLFATAETGGKARLVSCVAGWDCEQVNRQQIEGYGLADHVHIVNPDSGAVLDASLRDAYQSGEAWLGFQWGTSGTALLLDLVRLEEPEYSDECWRTTRACAYQDATILIGANSGLLDRAPDVADFLREWDFSVDVHLKSVSRWQADNPDASMEDTTLYWLSNNVATWSEWVTEEAAAGILATLPEPTDECGQTLTGDGSVSGEWAEGCNSQASGRGYAQYYTFTLAQESEVTVTLESSDADTYLYLRAGEARSGEFLYENDDDGGTTRSSIQETLGAGTYTIEATTYSAGETGSFTLTVSGLGATGTTPPGPEPTDDCGQMLTGDGSVSGEWAEGCQSEVSGRGYAQYYTFTLAQESEVTVTLESSEADTYLYLRAGEARSGDFLAENDDHESSTSRSLIARTLAAGTYTIEATTYSEGEAGSFTLTVAGLGTTTTPGPEPSDPCGQTLTSDGTVSGQWAAGCESEQRDGRHARYYTFALDQESEVTITLESSEADTYLYLRAGQARSGDFLHQNDDLEAGNTNSRVTATLEAGDYTVEATTYGAGETGSFTLTPSGLGTAAGPTPSVPALWFDAESQPFDDSRVRFAVSYAIDQELINQIFWDGRGDLQSPVPDALFPQWTTELDDPGVLQEWHLYDPEESRRLLSDAGYADGLETRMHVLPRWAQWAEVIAEMLAEVAIIVDVVISDPARIAELGQVSHQSMIVAPLQGFGGDVAAFIREHFTDEGQHNYSRLASDLPEEILSEFVGTEDPERRRELVYNLQNYLHDWWFLVPLPAPPTPPASTDPCIEPLAGLVTIIGDWDEDACASEVPGRGYARYFSFTVAQASEVTITLESSEADTYLYLRAGEDRSGEPLHQNDDLESGNTNSRIQETLEAGAYTIEATTYSEGETGSFTLTVAGLGTTATTPGPDRAALVALYNATDGPNWVNNGNWLSDEALGEWYGVTTDGGGRVTRLDLNTNQLIGEIPPELGSLSNLQWLEVGSGSFSCNAQGCEPWSPSANRLSGEMPAELGDLTNLRRLNLSANQLSGEIPSELGNLANLEVLRLTGNRLNGEIPSELGSLPSLENLNLSFNQLSGEIPSELGDLANLRSLNLSGNQLSGEIPPALGSLDGLQSLALSDNRLSGETPSDWGTSAIWNI